MRQLDTDLEECSSIRISIVVVLMMMGDISIVPVDAVDDSGG